MALHAEDYKMLRSKIKRQSQRWRDIPGSWTGKLNIVKVSILPNSKEILIRMLAGFFFSAASKRYIER